MSEEKESLFDKAKETASDLKGRVTGGGEGGDDGLLGKAKDLAGGVKEKVSGVLQKNEEKIDSGIDKAADFVDGKTKGRFSEHIGKAKGAAHGGVGKLAGKGGTDGERGEGGSKASGESGEAGGPGGTAGGLAAEPAHGLVHQDAGVGQGVPLALGAGAQQELAHGGAQAHAHGRHVGLDELHGVVDAHARRD